MKRKKDYISQWLKLNAESDQSLAGFRESVFEELENDDPRLLLRELSISFIELEDQINKPTISETDFLIKAVGTHLVRTWANEYLISKTVASSDE